MEAKKHGLFKRKNPLQSSCKNLLWERVRETQYCSTSLRKLPAHEEKTFPHCTGLISKKIDSPGIITITRNVSLQNPLSKEKYDNLIQVYTAKTRYKSTAKNLPHRRDAPVISTQLIISRSKFIILKKFTVLKLTKIKKIHCTGVSRFHCTTQPEKKKSLSLFFFSGWPFPLLFSPTCPYSTLEALSWRFRKLLRVDHTWKEKGKKTTHLHFPNPPLAIVWKKQGTHKHMPPDVCAH